MPKRVTITDVARAAGVSIMTVSRVVNDSGRVGATTRGAVQRAIRELGYSPSQVARGLTTRKSMTIGLIVPDITNPFFPEIVRGAEDAAWNAGFVVSLANTVEDPGRERAALRNMEGHRVDGVIVCSARLPTAELDELLRRHPATVLVNRRSGDAQATSLVVDDALGTRLAVEHLLSRGRRRIALVTGPDRSASAIARREGYVAALTNDRLAVDPDLVERGGPNEEDGYRAMHALSARRAHVDAVVAYNDLVALGVLRAARELGLEVPRDVAVVGCDDVRLASLVTPALTTLRVDKYDLGRRAAALLFERLHGRVPADVTVDPELVTRASAP
ncbi:LacI family DNA-binding transcriptional regulator [soil metagenome]